uniref:NADH dehydrogenase subunit 6 n=1 Tax=Phyllocoptes taishanensis TaxID=1638174 RepID=A0A0U2JEU3_9ACAR|nr:NADH dehydrogenase subunit 6 [Phyllocoptes taishanensis]ALK03805.1 NADH dehydrogenase subunit 6 [Phyllocoptes taishanensis]
MITTTLGALTYTVWVTKYSMGPMKLAVNLLIMSVLLMTLLSMKMGLSWLSLVYVMLFTGGILMMFMILSSFLPNEKSTKLNVSTLALAIPFMVSIQNLDPSDILPTTTMKWVLEASSTSISLMAIMLLYFVAFLENVSSDKLPMR